MFFLYNIEFTTLSGKNGTPANFHFFKNFGVWFSVICPCQFYIHQYNACVLGHLYVLVHIMCTGYGHIIWYLESVDDVIHSPYNYLAYITLLHGLYG